MAAEHHLKERDLKIFMVGLSYAIEAMLLLNCIEGSDHLWRTLRKGVAVEALTKDVQDRFAAFFNECRIDPYAYEEVKTAVFSEWTDFA